MKTNKTTVRGLAVAVMFVVFCTFSGLATAYDEERLRNADKHYQEGVASFAKRDIQRAINSFKRSYDFVPYAVTAYYLSVIFYELGWPNEADAYARRALAAKPPLPPLSSDLVVGARKVIDEVQKYKQQVTTTTTEYKGTADDFGPRPPPLKVKLPGSRSCVVKLLSPKNEEVLNQRASTEGKVQTAWRFSWSPCPGASRYHLYVVGPSALNPIVNIDTLTTTFYLRKSTHYGITDVKGWTWKVKAFVDGRWGEWSETRTFDVNLVSGQ